MTAEEKLKEASSYDLIKTIAGCHVFIGKALAELQSRWDKESPYGTCVCGTEKDVRGCPNGH